MDITTRQQKHADALVSLGLDRAAEILADWIAGLGEDEHYTDGAEDALITLIQAGAADPGVSPKPEIVHLDKPLRVACGITGRVRVTERFSETTCPRCLYDGDPVARTRALQVDRAHAEALTLLAED